MEIFEQGLALAVGAGTNTVQLRINRIRQFLGACVIGPARSSKHGARGVAQVLPEMSDEKLPSLLNSFAARTCECQILKMERLQIKCNLVRIDFRAAKSFLGAPPQAL